MTVERHSGLILAYKIVKNTMPENISSWITRTSLVMTGAAAFEIRARFRHFKHTFSFIVITRFSLVIHLPVPWYLWKLIMMDDKDKPCHDG